MSVLRNFYETLDEYFRRLPPQPWWPQDPMEVVVAAILVQGTSWRTVDPVLADLKSRNLLNFENLLNEPVEQLVDLISSVGFQTKKAARLKDLASMVLQRSGGDLQHFFSRNFQEVRQDLLSIAGVGPSTADNILLYGAKFPVYMVDPFTIRIFSRHGIIGAHTKDQDIQKLIHQELTHDEEPYGAELYSRFQAHLVRVGREYCFKNDPKCEDCPLQSLLPEDGPIGLGSGEHRPLRTSAKKPATSARLSSDSGSESASIQTPSQPDAVLLPLEELNLNPTEQTIVRLLGVEPSSIDTVVYQSGLPVHLVRATIAFLEMRGILQLFEGNKVKRVR